MLRPLLQEPLVHFLAIGALLFVLFGMTREPGGEHADRIVVDAGDVDRLSARFSRTWMRPPTADELSGLIDGFVREEIYYREALALGLDQDDPMVRQRMRQKLEFLLEDLSEASAPSDAELARFLSEHGERFAVPPRISFRQVYLNPDRHADLDAVAADVLAALRAGADAETLGDRTLLGYAFESVTPPEIARSFGGDFAHELAALEPGEWRGPVDSGLGRHFVQILDRQPGHLPPLEQIRDRVEREWRIEQQQAQKEAAYRRLREGYEVIIEPAGVSDSPRPEAQVTGR